MSQTGACIASSISTLLTPVNTHDPDDTFSVDTAVVPQAVHVVETNDDEEPKAKRQALDKSNTFPEPCPVPPRSSFSKRTCQAIDKGNITGNAKLRLLREAAMYYYSLTGENTSTPYVTIAKTLCTKYLQLKDKKPPIPGEYWVSAKLQRHAFIYIIHKNYIHACMQDSVRKYMSQKFRNLRRVSEPPKTADHSSNKISSHDFAKLPIPAEQETEDELSYERNVESLLDEFARAAPSHKRMYHLLKLTHKTRREHIESSMVHSSTIKEQYPYLGIKKWVYINEYTCVYIYNNIIIIHACIIIIIHACRL